jgi:hypothetical protein
MKHAERKKIQSLHHLHKQQQKTTLAYDFWIATYFWNLSAKEHISEFLHSHINLHGPITTICSFHPTVQEHTPLHLPYLYQHDISFEDGFHCILFQKFNFSQNVTSLITSLIWSYLPQLSTTFRKQHRMYERSLGRPLPLVHPHPRSLWENYTLFLSTIGAKWKSEKSTSLGPIWVVLTDNTAVTLSIPGHNQDTGSSVYSHLVNMLHQRSFQKKQYEVLGASLGKAIHSCYTQKIAFLDNGLGNYILDSEEAIRFIDGEFLQVLPDGVPSHYKALELVLFMEDIYIETVRDYCRTINSKDPEAIRNYLKGLLVFFSNFLKKLHLSNDELALALKMFNDWSTRIGTFCFTMFLCLQWDARVMSSYRVVLKKDLEKIIQKQISS